jgi:membrane protease YdiL (CAAX protease family)
MRSLKNKLINSLGENRIFVLVAVALLVQMFGHYYAQKYNYDFFYYLWVILRIIVPVMVLFIMKIPVSELGLKLPKLDKKIIIAILSMCFIFALFFMFVSFWGEYLKFYSNAFGGAAASKLTRFNNFAIFTSSTLTGWEFLHRSFLLMAGYYILTNDNKLDKKNALKIAIIIPWIFEVVFHFAKPQYEAIGMLIGSPILSYFAFKTKSIWTAFFAHLYVELLFICMVIFAQ